MDLEPFDSKKGSLPPYDWSTMAPQRWRISEWKNVRLEPYRLIVKGITVYRGDGTPSMRDLQLGNLRDSYFEAAYGPIRLQTTGEEEPDEKVVDLAKRRKK